MLNSILQSTKQVIGIAQSYTVFDENLIMAINTHLAQLTQLGLGPDEGMQVTDETNLWSEFFGNDKVLNMARSYIFLNVKLEFDPPATSFAIGAIEKQIEKLEWRLNVHREELSWTDPDEAVTV